MTATDAPPAALSRSRHLRPGLILLATVAALTVSTLFVLRARYPSRLATVEPGALYRSSQPSTRQLRAVVERFGIRTVLIVRSGESRSVPDEVEFAETLGLKVVRIPIESRTPISEEQVRQFFACVDDPASRPVLVHCAAGRHRTGYLCARYRIDRQGWSPEDAIDEMLSFGFDIAHQGVVLEQLRGYRPASLRQAAALPPASPRRVAAP